MKQEVEFYPEICEKFNKYLLSCLPAESEIAFSYDKLLPKMVQEIESKLNGVSVFSGRYIPLLKLDILFGIKHNDDPIKFILLEVKYSDMLTLANYSQLVGYMQVAKQIKAGILFLVDKGRSVNYLSTDFSNILLTDNLPMTWNMSLGELAQYQFRSGICNYRPNSNIIWKYTTDLCGISSYKELLDSL